ncbi:P-loop containing nucleoside triphosphate hydrolase protein [Rhizophagus irregularis]|uniref:P-loop containing nucleoside triphosphate hydrolase protein n=1 Tax=Rhizophagus irregularis TaxID=588596 RepID=A0A2I1GK60_9GLOM|nr:P-loop containing nucleoside triphosphate hydrolase protein [Rhizophagus irregularis]
MRSKLKITHNLVTLDVARELEIQTLTGKIYDLARKVDAKRTYDPPGELSKEGRRHDNDFVEIGNISIIPTREEILCDRKPFLPSTLPDSLHFLPYGVNRLLDTQFRLLREDMLNPIRGGIYSFLNELLKDWSSPNNNSKLSMELKKIQERGGRFKYNNGISDNGDLQVYTHIQFVKIGCNRRKGFYCTIRFNSPRFRNSESQRGRRDYWEKTKKLLTGSLIAIILSNPNPKQTRSNNSFNNNDNISISNSDLYSIYFGVVTLRDENALSRDADYCDIDISFVDRSIYSLALNEISKFEEINRKSLEKRFMVESIGVYFESYYHILKTLKETDPNTLPFGKYLVPNLDDLNNNNNNENVEEGRSIFSAVRRASNNLTSSSSKSIIDVAVENPLYTGAPGFQFDLSVLFKNEQSVKLNVADTISHNEVIKVIKEKSKIGKSSNGDTYGLDETQAQALIFALTREIALIEGPPGTGKTVVGIQIMKVLLAKENRKTGIGPILTICFTNHALDQFLEHLLDENISNIVKLGSRSKSERINKKKFFKKFNYVTYNDLPYWVLGNGSQKSFDGSETVHKKKKKKLSTFERWVNGEDITVINKRKLDFINLRNNIKKNNDAKGSYHNTFEVLEEGSNDDEIQVDYVDYDTINWVENYEEPKTDRPIEVLLSDYSIWKMSKVERLKLLDYWRKTIYQRFEQRLSNLQKMYDEKRQEMDDMINKGCKQVLLNSDVIGMTTNGAAKFQDLIRSVNPKIIICEEAGEVLEAHILGVLTPSIQHLILIGDHNQLRPHIATYSLSMDSLTGKIYQLDKSLFERLVNGDNAVKIEKAQLLTQKRMRKEVSDLIRYTLYPNLVDGDNTAKYENVRGAQHNVYFIDHRHPEDGSGDDFVIQSHTNMYEVKMVVEIVKYFVSNGYTKSDDIAVLTPYLGQMMKIREALAKSFVVVVDERDEQNIIELEEEREGEGNDNRNNNNNINSNIFDKSVGAASIKSLNQQVTLRTVDNFQECWQIQEKPTCMELVTIKLPTCGHCKVMNCTASVDNAECKEKCGRQLACGHECLNECHECQKLYVPQESGEFDTNVPIKRTIHGNCRALCNKPLFCGHLCKQNCHKGYECSPCKNRCSISCEHTRCNGHCLEPCALCAEKCSWECKHQGRCELSCGIPCSRLPCNERCDKVLKCGHKCAGVCGEICPSISYCVDCASETVKNQVSDTITDTIFSEIDWDQERMIILSCGHVFTMKSMDTLMEMKNYYKGSIDGGWTSAKMLPTSSTDIKTCPGCNSPIRDIKRYGRITKKYTLDAQNKKFLLKYYYQLDEIRKQINFFVFGGKLRKNRIQLKEDLIEILESESISRGEVTFKECKNTELPEIIPYYYFENIGIYHGFDENSEQIWIVHVKKLLKRYNELTFIVRATKFPPHKKALEASISNL